jgi:hypothetical protein
MTKEQYNKKYGKADGDYLEYDFIRDLQEIGGATEDQAEEIIEEVYAAQDEGFQGDLLEGWMDEILQKLLEFFDDGEGPYLWFN